MMTTASPRILVVDDNDDNRYTLTMYLDLEGYQNVATANDGEEAVALLESESFDLVLLDVMMPRLDGFGVLAWLKTKGRLHHLPVIMISAQNEIESVVRCIELGAVDYLTKPFNKVLLRARLGSSLEKKRLRDQIRAHLTRLEQELNAARTLQLGMVPQSFPSADTVFPWDVHASIAPALEVGGDLYDVFRAPNGDLCFFIGDVSGKGMPAALFMARTKSLIRIITELTARAAPVDPAAVITRVNVELCEGNDSLMFVTLFFGVLSPGGELSYCNAGHNPPYRVAGAVVTPLVQAAGLVLGVEAGFAYRSATTKLASGDGLFLYTDGVTEAFNAADVPYGEGRLEAVLGRAQPTSRSLIEAVTADVAAFVGITPASDDVAMLAIYRAAEFA
ncbi:MAG: SpoIIE family protein phosphatase [Alphaproteobacteria bacterium]|nr:SpoIIE family protein phosphatase [Alphaproteobacteria bacterium]